MKMGSSSTDEELMIAYIGGDRGAFDELFGRYAPRIHALFVRTFRSTALADDLLQTTFLKVHSARTSYRRELPVRPWLFAIAARVRIDELRRRYRTASTESDAELAELSLPVDGAGDEWPEQHQKAERVRQAIDALPDGQRMVVLLHRFEGMSFGEIASTLSASEGTVLTEVAVRVRAFRAYAALRTALADFEEEVVA